MTSNTYNLKKQIALATHPDKSLAIDRKMYSRRFPDEDVSDLPLKQLMVREGNRIQKLYAALAEKYHVGWKGRRRLLDENFMSQCPQDVLQLLGIKK